MSTREGLKDATYLSCASFDPLNSINVKIFLIKKFDVMFSANFYSYGVFEKLVHKWLF